MVHGSALLVLDMQESILENFSGAEGLTSRVATAITAARDKKIPVIYVVSGFRKHAPDLSVDNKFYGAHQEHYRNGDPADLLKIQPGVQPLSDDIIVNKRRFGAFEGTDLEIVLRSLSIRHIVLTGFSTGGVVLSTIRSAADKDYTITLLAEACSDRDEDVHRVLLTKIFPRQADVISLDEWILNK